MVRHAGLFSQLAALFHRGQFIRWVFRHQARAVCQRLQQTGSFRSHALLPTRPSRSVCAKSAADCPDAWENSGIWASKRLPTNPRCPVPMPIAPGNSIATCFTRRSISVRWPLLGNIAFVSKTSFCRWRVQPSRCACPCSRGLSFAAPRGPLNAPCCWIMTDIWPAFAHITSGKKRRSHHPPKGPAGTLFHRGHGPGLQ